MSPGRRLIRLAAWLAAAMLAGGCTSAPPPPPDSATAAQAVFARHCGSCHRLDGRNTGPGPDLSTIGARRSALEIRTKILNPGAWRAQGNYQQGIMPMTFANVLKPEEIDLLVNWLATLRGGATP